MSVQKTESSYELTDAASPEQRADCERLPDHRCAYSGSRWWCRIDAAVTRREPVLLVREINACGRAAASADVAETRTHAATEGTPFALTTNSMYIPGGAMFPFAGAVTVSPPAVCENASGM